MRKSQGNFRSRFNSTLEIHPVNEHIFICFNQETQTKYEKSIQQIKQLKEEMEELKKYYNELKAKEGFNGKTEAQLLEEKARLIVDKQNMEEQSIAYKNILKEFETLKTSHTRLSEEKNTLSTKVFH